MPLALAEFPSSSVFDDIAAGLAADPAEAKKVIGKAKAVFVFTLANKEGKKELWALDLKDKGTVSKIAAGDPVFKSADITINVLDVNFKKLATGKANAQKLFMSGKLKVKGNVMKATVLEDVLKAKPKL